MRKMPMAQTKCSKSRMHHVPQAQRVKCPKCCIHKMLNAQNAPLLQVPKVQMPSSKYPMLTKQGLKIQIAQSAESSQCRMLQVPNAQSAKCSKCQKLKVPKAQSAKCSERQCSECQMLKVPNAQSS